MEVHRDRSIMRQIPDLREDLSPRLLAAFFLLNQRLNIRAEPVEGRIFVPPWIAERGGVERSGYLAHLSQVEQPRTRGNEQAHRKLDGRDVFNQIQFNQGFEQRTVIAPCRPWRKRDERWRQRQAGVPHYIHGFEEIRSRVAFVQSPKHALIERFDRRYHEQASCGAQATQQFTMLQQMLDLDGNVVRQPWEFRMKSAHN